MADSANDKLEVGDIIDVRAIAIGAGAIAIY